MRKWMLELAAGFVPVLFIFLAFIGYNAIPLLVGIVMLGALFAAVKMRGGIVATASQERKRKKSARPI